MNSSTRFFLSAVFAVGVSVFAAGAASAMPAARVGVDAASGVEQAHAVRVCDRWGRCWWTHAGHRHGGYYGWRRPYYGWHGGHWGWRGRGWHGHRGWRGHGWHGHHGWHGRRWR